MSDVPKTETGLKSFAVILVEPFKSGGLLNNAIRTGVLGLWLFTLYFASSWLVIYSFSAHQFNNAINNVEKVENIQLTRWQIRNIFLEWAPQQARLDVINGDILNHSIAIRKLAAEVAEAQAAISKNNQAVNIALGGISDLAIRKGLDGTLAWHHYAGNSEASNYLPEQINELVQVIGKDPLLDQLNKAKATYQKSIGQLDEINAKTKSINGDIDTLNTQLASIQANLKKTLILKGIDGKIVNLPPKIGDFLNELAFFKPQNEGNLAFGWIRIPNPTRLIDMPPEMLTLVLVLCMGALGSTIHLTQVYFSQRSNSVSEQRENGLGFWYFLFRPLQGCVTALAVYIFFKAGILVASTPSAGDQSAQISPYFVSFIGIISGLLAQNAINTIQRVGNNWFSNSSTLGRERWAVGLDAKIGSETKTRDEIIKELANQTGVNEDGINDWAVEKDSVPYKHQPIIAAFFRVPVREIFSDLQPRPAPVAPDDTEQE